MSLLIELAGFSALLSVVLALLSKLLTNQTEIKKIKKEMSEHRQKISQAKKENNAQEIKHNTDKMFKLSQSQMKSSTRPMLVSMIIVIVAFGWLGGRYGHLIADIDHGQGEEHADIVGLLGEEKQKLVIYAGGAGIGFDSNSNGVIEDSEKHPKGDLIPYKGGYLNLGEPAATKITAEIVVAKAPFTMPFVGSNLTWFWLYIFITIPTTLIFRKLLDIQ